MSILDKIGGFLGGGLGEKIADIVGKRVQDKDLATKLTHELAVLATTQEHEARQAILQAEQQFEAELTKRVQADASSGDPYTQRTRPMIARQSWYAGCGYIGVSVASQLFPQYVAMIVLDWGILMAIYSPALTYMGVRSFDKWSRVK